VASSICISRFINQKLKSLAFGLPAEANYRICKASSPGPKTNDAHIKIVFKQNLNKSLMISTDLKHWLIGSIAIAEIINRSRSLGSLNNLDLAKLILTGSWCIW